MKKINNILKNKIYKIICDFVSNGYGLGELRNPSYDLKEMSEFIIERIGNFKKINGVIAFLKKELNKTSKEADRIEKNLEQGKFCWDTNAEHRAEFQYGYNVGKKDFIKELLLKIEVEND